MLCIDFVILKDTFGCLPGTWKDENLIPTLYLPPPSQKHTNMKGSYDNQGVSFKVVSELGG